MPSEDTPTVIELKDITKRYGFGPAASFALQNFSLTVKRGEFIMVMGPSGCGKTTLLNVIGLLDKTTSGTYLLDGKPTDKLSSRKKSRLRAERIGVIFQNFNLISTLPVIENVALPLVYSGASKTSRLKKASATLEKFHLETREYFLPTQLSGGQQQRVAIARSLVADPEIILADEPTGNLDSRSSHIVMEELRNIHAAGNTIIMVTHNPNLTTYATRVIHMLDGHIDTDIKTVDDADLPQPVSVRIVKTEKQSAEKAEKTKKTEKTEKTEKSAPKSKKSKSTPEKSPAKSEKSKKSSAKKKPQKKSTKKPTKKGAK